MELNEVLAELEKLDTYDIEDDPMCGMFSNYRTMVKQTGSWIDTGEYVRRDDMLNCIRKLIAQHGD